MRITFNLEDSNDTIAVIKCIEAYNGKPIVQLLGRAVTQEVSVVKESVTQEASVSQEETDANGVPWNVNFHTPQKTLTGKGLWRRAQRISKRQYDGYAAPFLIPPAAPALAAPEALTPALTSALASASAPTPPTPVKNSDLLEEIDSIFADLDELGKIDNFPGWASSILNWAKPGSNCINDLKGDIASQEKLFDHLQSLI